MSVAPLRGPGRRGGRQRAMRRRQWTLGSLVTVLAGTLLAVGGLDRMEGPTLDWRARWFGRFSPAPSPDIVIVGIDDQSIESVGPWPWDRAYLATAVRELTRAGARVIALDVLLAESRGGASFSAQGDHELAEAIAEHGAVVVTGQFRAEPLEAVEGSSGDDPGSRRRAFAAQVDAAADELSDQVHPPTPPVVADAETLRARRVAETILEATERSTIPAPQGARWVPCQAPAPMDPLFVRAAASMCNASILAPEAGGVLRRVPVWVDYRDRLWPALGIGAAAKFIELSGNGADGQQAPVQWEVDSRRTRITRGGDAFELPMIAARAGPVRADGLDLVTWPRASSKYQSQFSPRDGPAHEISIGSLLAPLLVQRSITDNLYELDKLFAAAADRNLYDPQVQKTRPRDLIPARPDDPDWRKAFQSLRPVGSRIAGEAADDLQLFSSAGDSTPRSEEEAATLAGLRAIAQGIPTLLGECADGIDRIDRRRSEVRDIARGRLCFIGWVATGAAADFWNTSINPKTPGVYVHAALANSILTGFSRRPVGLAVNLLFVGLLGIAGTALGMRALPALVPITVGALVIAWFLVCGVIFWDASRLVASVVGPSLAAGGSALVVILHRLLVEEVSRRRTEQRFRSYVSPAVVDILVENPRLSSMAPQERELTVMFSDLEGFTAVAERLGSVRTGDVLGAYLGEMTRALQASGATLDKYLGDGIMAFWGAPLEDPNHASNACRAVLNMLDALESMNARGAFGEAGPLRMRIGLAAGEVMVGDFGNPPHNSAYTVLGDAANLASRLEHLDKQLGTGILASDRVRALAGEGFRWRRVGTVAVRGRAAATAVHELIGSTGAADRPAAPKNRHGGPEEEWIRLTEAAVQEYQQGRFDHAGDLFRRLAAEFGDTSLARVYLNSIETLAKGGAKTEFDGTIVLPDL